MTIMKGKPPNIRHKKGVMHGTAYGITDEDSVAYHLDTLNSPNAWGDGEGDIRAITGT